MLDASVLIDGAEQSSKELGRQAAWETASEESDRESDKVQGVNAERLRGSQLAGEKGGGRKSKKTAKKGMEMERGKIKMMEEQNWKTLIRSDDCRL